MSEEKPIKPKPHFYAHCFAGLLQEARLKGYNLVLHGSMDRDLDLIAIPWTNDPANHLELIHSFCEYLGVPQRNTKEDYMYGLLPGGRSSYIINLNRGGKFNGYLDAKYYLDISITPFLT